MGGFTTDAIEALESYEWKGNVREMRNAIERITLLESGEMITKDSIRFLRVGMGSQSAGQPLASGHHLTISKQGASLESVMRDLLEQTLKLAEGNQTQAAKMLGITRAVLKTRMEQSGLAPEADL
jgi:DNA-binding NtrC family response regulator